MNLYKLAALVLALCIPLTALSEELTVPADMSVPAEEAVTVYTPGRESCGKPGCFWETPMDYTDAQAVWAMLTAPMTVVDGNFRTREYLRAEPREDSAAIGEITRASQGVHVLEQLDNGWTKVECFSSSFAGSKVKAWNELVVGYVPTDALKTVEVRTEYGLIIDKLTQRLYIYREGEFLDELQISTGLATKSDPENETRAGEFLLFSPTGAFPSEPFICNYGIRYNDGDLLHEIPHLVNADGTQNYSRTEGKVGSRASHGCIRVQRKRTPNGINMRWIWNNLKDQMGTRMVVWEDWMGRSIPIPPEDTVLYYNPKNGSNYHDSPTCYGVLDRYEPMKAFTYGELDVKPYAKLTACPYCVPPREIADIEKINAAHFPTEEQPQGSPFWQVLPKDAE